jgi:hypothetical protein
MIPQHPLPALRNLSSSKRQATGVWAKENVDLIRSDEALGQCSTLRRLTCIVVRRQA